MAEKQGQRQSRFGTLSNAVKKEGLIQPLANEKKLEEDRSSQSPLSNLMVDPPAAPIIEKKKNSKIVDLKFAKVCRITAYQDQLLDIYYALNKDDHNSKSHLLNSIIEDFFEREENRPYVKLLNNKK